MTLVTTQEDEDRLKVLSQKKYDAVTSASQAFVRGFLLYVKYHSSSSANERRNVISTMDVYNLRVSSGFTIEDSHLLITFSPNHGHTSTLCIVGSNENIERLKQEVEAAPGYKQATDLS
jgi:hypothetical protein